MFKRARISFLVALIGATCGFIGLLDSSVAETVFYLFMALALLSFLFAFFEDEVVGDSPHGSVLQTRRIQEPEPH